MAELTLKIPIEYTNNEKLQFLLGLEEKNRLRFNKDGDLAKYRKIMKAVHFLRNPLLDYFFDYKPKTEEKEVLLQSYKTDNPMNADLDKDISYVT